MSNTELIDWARGFFHKGLTSPVEDSFVDIWQAALDLVAAHAKFSEHCTDREFDLHQLDEATEEAADKFLALLREQKTGDDPEGASPA